MISYSPQPASINRSAQHSVLASGNFNNLEMVNVLSDQSVYYADNDQDKVLYFLHGEGDLRLEGKFQTLVSGEIIQIKAGEKAQITACTNLRFLLLK